MSCRCNLHKRLSEARIASRTASGAYFDYNATTPIDKRVLGVYYRSATELWAHPESVHYMGVSVFESLERITDETGRSLGVNPAGVSYCSGGSEGLHAGIWGIMSRDRKIRGVTTAIEHGAVLNAFTNLFPDRTTMLPVNEEGKVDLEELKKVVSKKPSLFVYSPVNHETGGLQDIKEIFGVCKRSGAVIFIDGVQAAARLPYEDWVPYCDMFTLSGHKICGPKGTGLLWANPEISLAPFRYGGSPEQDSPLFPGTGNPPGIAALGTAISLAESERREETVVLGSLIKDGLTILDEHGVTYINESPPGAAPGIVCLSFPWVRSMEEFLFFLNRNKIAVSRFSACTGDIQGESKVLSAMGRGADRSSTSVRISCGRESKRSEWYLLADVLKTAMKQGL